MADAPRRRRRSILDSPSPILHLLSSILSLAFLLTPTGCQPVGAVVNKVVGEPPVPARYVPDRKKPILVLVENYRNPAATRMDAQRLTIHLADELRRYDIASVVDVDEADAIHSRADYHDMNVEDVGRAAGAKQVLYVNLQQVGIDNTVGGEMLKAHADLRVRVVDVDTGRTLWPHDAPEGVALTAETPWSRTPAGDREGLPEPALRDQVARTAATQIVKMFRKWRPDDEPMELENSVQ